ncbi:MAG: sugar nucleotide-binding protein [Thermoplasmata archaeon]|nr:sugar nucleotide-binding protein [Thermoplasmata archaeon]
MVGSHYAMRSGKTIHAAGRTDPSSRGISVEGFSSVQVGAPAEIENFVRNRPEPVVVNFAARTDVDGVERERASPGEPLADGEAWRINALAPEALARAARLSGKYFLQISTDFVFDGSAGPYDESVPRSSLSSRLSWYGWTKSEGERRVEEQAPRAGILRIAYPYRSSFPPKLDFARGMVARQRAGTLPSLYADQLLTPTWVPDVTKAVNLLTEAQQAGIFHAASPDPTTPYDFAEHLFHRLRAEGLRLERGSLASALERPGATPRPLKGGLRSHRLPQLGLGLTGWREGVDLLATEEGWM